MSEVISWFVTLARKSHGPFGDCRAIAEWWAYVVRHEAREFWRTLPGPWWVKVALVVVTQVIPGPLDEIILLAVIGAARWAMRKVRQWQRSS